jgi:hypothetical protein
MEITKIEIKSNPIKIYWAAGAPNFPPRYLPSFTLKLQEVLFPGSNSIGTNE